MARLIDAAANEGREEQVGEIAHLLLDQARISEGEAVPDPAAFAKRLANALRASLGA